MLNQNTKPKVQLNHKHKYIEMQQESFDKPIKILVCSICGQIKKSNSEKPWVRKLM